ncbi:MAG TPA: alpha/beta fold hydrolase [Methylomirabilota bacterium]|nr:alpha/beta fold hydrolase [Methylomirabilota bacterium]
MSEEEAVVVQVPGGPALQAALGAVSADRGGFVLCHPHPLYGGDMDNPVVIRAAEVCRHAGYATLRFNFRGVGGSAGRHDKGEGEQDDIRAAVATLASRLPPGRPVGVIGYSFGAWTAARAMRPGDAPLGLIAPPLGMFDFDRLGRDGGRLLVVAGTRDPYCPLDALHRLTRATGAEERVIEGADHFFFGRLFPLGEAIEAWLAGTAPAR